MGIKDIVIIAIIVVIIGLATLYIYKAKKSGKKCIGCPYGDACSKINKEACSGCKKSCDK